MKTISAPAIAAIATGRVGIVQLILLAFTPTPVALNMSTWDLTWQRRVNLLTYSNNFQAGIWDSYYGGVVITPGQLAPDGTMTASKFDPSTSATNPSLSGVINSTTLPITPGMVASIWLRADVPCTINMGIDDSSSPEFNLTTTWTRYQFAGITPNGTGRAFQMHGNGSSTNAWYAWGAQVEIAETASAYTPTTAIPLNEPGTVYKGAYGLGSISAINDKPGEVAGLNFELAAGSSSVIALALDDADVVQGTPVTIRTAIIDMDTRQILDAPIEWVGTLDTMSIGEDGTQAAINCTAESKAVDLLRGTPMVYGDADQRTINAADGSMRWIVDQIDKPVIWPQKAFFYQ